MKNVLYIGKVDNNGVFTNNNWYILLNWLSKRCDNIRIYSTMNINEIEKLYSKYCKIEKENFPDLSSNIKGYRLWCEDNKIWDLVAVSNFHIDNGITHIYFLDKNEYKAELQIDDCENFVILDITKEEEIDLKEIIRSDNIKYCSCWKEQINYLIDNEPWRPLGEI